MVGVPLTPSPAVICLQLAVWIAVLAPCPIRLHLCFANPPSASGISAAQKWSILNLKTLEYHRPHRFMLFHVILSATNN